MPAPPPLPARVDPVEFGELGRMVAVRCPKEFAHIVQRAGGVWEPGLRRRPIRCSAVLASSWSNISHAGVKNALAATDHQQVPS